MSRVVAVCDTVCVVVMCVHVNAVCHGDTVCVVVVVVVVVVATAGEPAVWDQHPVLEDHRHPGGPQDGQTRAAAEHPDRGYHTHTHTHTHNSNSSSSGDIAAGGVQGAGGLDVVCSLCHITTDYGECGTVVHQGL